MNKKVFFTLPEKRNLYLKHVFFEDIQPIFFLCEDSEDNLYICVMCDDRNGRTWIVSPTRKHYVSKMIFNEITMRNLFELSGYLGHCWIIKCIEGNWQYRAVSFDRMDEDDLPEKGAFFNADFEEIREYFIYVYDKIIKVRNGNISFNKEPIDNSILQLHNNLLKDKQKQRDLPNQYNKILLMRKKNSPKEGIIG